MSKALDAYVHWKKLNEKIKEELYCPFVLDSLNRSSRVQWCLAYKLILSITQTNPGTNWAT